MQRTYVRSAALVWVAFDAATNTVEAEFTSGGVYRYFAVPRRVYDEVLASESVGAAFNRLIRDVYSVETVRS